MGKEERKWAKVDPKSFNTSFKAHDVFADTLRYYLQDIKALSKLIAEIQKEDDDSSQEDEKIPQAANLEIFFPKDRDSRAADRREE